MRTRYHAALPFDRTRATLLALALVASGASTAAAQRQSMLLGHVIAVDGAKPLHGAVVTMDSLRLRARTDSTGAFLLAPIPAGLHAIHVQRDGYALLDTALTFSGRDTVTTSFALDAAADTLDPTEAKMVDFERRRAKGLGWFITRDALAGHYDRELSEVLRRRIPGIALNRNRNGGAAVASTRGVGSPMQQSSGDGYPPACYVQLYVDGVRVFAPGTNEPPPDINEWRTTDVEGVEYYSGIQDTPPEYAGFGAVCGTLALWLRVQ